MKIVALDAETLMIDGLDWSPLEALGSLERFERTSAEQVRSRAADADVLIVNKVKIGAKELLALPNLKLIAVAATGHNVVDTAKAREYGVAVCNVPAYSSASVAQHAWSLILNISNHVTQEAESVRKGDWNQTTGWSYMLSPITEWSGKTIGIVGLGQIGSATAKIAEAFGMNVIYHNRKLKQNCSHEWVSMDSLFAQSDVISLHCPETQENHGFVKLELIKKMKPSAILINTSRGGLINQEDLAQALNHGLLRAAGLDVLQTEPPTPGNPLIGCTNCFITPHVAWASFESKSRLLATLVNNVARFSNGQPINIVN